MNGLALGCVAMALVAVVHDAAAQTSPPDARRFSGALGVTTPRVGLPQMASASLNGRLLGSPAKRVQLQVDATVTAARLGGLGGIASLEAVVFNRPFGLSMYNMLGIAIASSRGLIAGGIGTEFRGLGRPLFFEFRMYGPEIHDYNGFRLGTRF